MGVGCHEIWEGNTTSASYARVTQVRNSLKLIGYVAFSAYAKERFSLDNTLLPLKASKRLRVTGVDNSADIIRLPAPLNEEYFRTMSAVDRKGDE